MRPDEIIGLIIFILFVVAKSIFGGDTPEEKPDEVRDYGSKGLDNSADGSAPALFSAESLKTDSSPRRSRSIENHSHLAQVDMAPPALDGGEFHGGQFQNLEDNARVAEELLDSAQLPSELRDVLRGAVEEPLPATGRHRQKKNKKDRDPELRRMDALARKMNDRNAESGHPGGPVIPSVGEINLGDPEELRKAMIARVILDPYSPNRLRSLLRRRQ